METVLQVLHPDFLLRNSVYISLLVGAVAPLVGVFLILRRLVFLGVALPQISSCGIVFAFALVGWGILPHHHDSERFLAFAGAIVFSVTAIMLLAVMERRGGGLSEGRIGRAYVLAGAFSFLLLAKNPLGEHGLMELLKGEIIAVSNADLVLTAVVFSCVAIAVLALRKELLLVSFDRDMAFTLGKNLLVWDAGMYLIIGLTVAVTVLSVGPLMAFGFLLLPPLTAYLFAKSIRQLIVGASVIGVVCAFAGFCLAYKFDLPAGPAEVALLGVVHLVALSGKRIAGWRTSGLRPQGAV
jgi:ABC-type Mn2+/Zn2+ transport system permease subunit